MKNSLRAGTFIALLAGAAALWAGFPQPAHGIWIAGTLFGLIPLASRVFHSLIRREPGVDLIAILAMGGSLAGGEYLAGVLIATMLAVGTALEDFAARRARGDLADLLGRAPRTAHRYEQGELVERAVDLLVKGDRVLVRPGEILPVDGTLDSALALLDESALTGEPLPVERVAGDLVRSGVANAGGPFDLVASAPASEGTYAAIVRLVQEAESHPAPMVRLADRYALLFTVVTFVVAGGAWLLSGDPIRALAVLVVATPCPLLLAAPVAIVSGLSRCARSGVIVKGGGALESLARAGTLVLDKTGTLTVGAPRLQEPVALGEFQADEVLRLAASLDQSSMHVYAAAIVAGARSRGLALAVPEAIASIEEIPGEGISGTIEGRRVRVGKERIAFGGVSADPDVARMRRRATLEGASLTFVSVDDRPAAVFVMSDPLREDAGRTVRALRSSGLTRIVMASGDQQAVAEAIAMQVGLDGITFEASPARKVELVRAERAALAGTGRSVVMVGDGINDAPALAEADVGVALGARGSSVASEAADVVLAVDRLDRLADAVRSARRARRIALQSILGGMGLSFVAMGFAAAGSFTPAAGALLQEVIDVAAILNALRALGGRPRPKVQVSVEALKEMHDDHARLKPSIENLRRTADRLDELDGPGALAELQAVRGFLEDELVPHEQEDEARIYPLISRAIGGNDPTATMSRTHHEIAHQTNVIARFVGGLPESGPDPEDRRDLKRMLYALHAILTLHFAQEDEHYLPLLGDPRDRRASGAAAAAGPASGARAGVTRP